MFFILLEKTLSMKPFLAWPSRFSLTRDAGKRGQHPRDAAATPASSEMESISALRHVQSDAQNRRLRRRANHLARRSRWPRRGGACAVVVRSPVCVPRRHPSDTADARCTVLHDWRWSAAAAADGTVAVAKNVLLVSRAPMRPVFHVSPPCTSRNAVLRTPDTITYHCHRRRRCRADNDDDGSIVEQHRTQRWVPSAYYRCSNATPARSFLFGASARARAPFWHVSTATPMIVAKVLATSRRRRGTWTPSQGISSREVRLDPR